MLMDYYPITIRDSIDTIMCYGTTNSVEKKFGFDKKTTIYRKVIMTDLGVMTTTTVNITYIEEAELIKLKRMWRDYAIIDIISENGKIYKGEITNEELNFTENLNNIENIYYYTGNITLEV